MEAQNAHRLDSTEQEQRGNKANADGESRYRIAGIVNTIYLEMASHSPKQIKSILI